VLIAIHLFPLSLWERGGVRVVRQNPAYERKGPSLRETSGMGIFYFRGRKIKIIPTS